MKQLAFFAGIVLSLAAAATPARADTVRLRNGRTLDGVRAFVRGDEVTIDADRGSITIPRRDVLEITTGPTREESLAPARDELARRRLAAGDEPFALRALSRWCRQSGLEREARELEALARGIDLEERLARLEPTKDPRPFLELARSMGEGYSDTERRVVLERALARDPENAEVRRALGQVARGGRWISLEEAARQDAEDARLQAEARERVAREEELARLRREVEQLAERRARASSSVVYVPTGNIWVATPAPGRRYRHPHSHPRPRDHAPRPERPCAPPPRCPTPVPVLRPACPPTCSPGGPRALPVKEWQR